MEHLAVCLRVLADRNELMQTIFGEQSRQVFANMLALKEDDKSKEKKVCFDIIQLLCVIFNL